MSYPAFYFGFATKFNKICIGKTTICLFEEYKRGSDGPSETVCRLHIIDKKTGIKKDRIYIGNNSELIGMRGDSVCYKFNKKIVIFNAAKLEEIYSLDEQDWKGILEDLSVGIESINSNQNRDAIVSPYIELHSKNGKTYWFEPFTKKINDTEPKDIYLNEFSKSRYELCIKKSINENLCYLKTQSINGNLEKIVPYDDSKLFSKPQKQNTYIEPLLIYIDTTKKFFLFSYYTTTDKNDYFIEGQDFAFNTIWKKSNYELNASDKYNTAQINTWKYENEIIYFNNGGFILAINPQTSKTIWITRL